jgi:hypothetical protein
MPNTLVMNQGTNLVQWGRAQYKLAYLIDTAQCVLPIDTTFVINDVPVDVKISELKPICIDKVHEYTFNVKGKSPWTIAYNVNNTTQKTTLNDSINRWTCDPGIYNIVQITDNNDCVLPINRIDTLTTFIESLPIISTNYTTISVNPTNLHTQWYLNGNLLDTLSYNTSTVRIVQDGEYVSALRDESGCIWASNSLSLNFPNNVNVYPNPCTSYFNVLIKENYGSYWQFKLNDMHGNTISEGEVDEPFLHWPCDGLSPGVYTIKIIYHNNSKPLYLRLLKR